MTEGRDRIAPHTNDPWSRNRQTARPRHTEQRAYRRRFDVFWSLRRRTAGLMTSTQEDVVEDLGPREGRDELRGVEGVELIDGQPPGAVDNHEPEIGIAQP